MKAMPWPDVLTLWGNEGERAMLDLVIDCGIFTLVPGSHAVYAQLSGKLVAWVVELLDCWYSRSTSRRLEAPISGKIGYCIESGAKGRNPSNVQYTQSERDHPCSEPHVVCKSRLKCAWGSAIRYEAYSWVRVHRQQNYTKCQMFSTDFNTKKLLIRKAMGVYLLHLARIPYMSCYTCFLVNSACIMSLPIMWTQDRPCNLCKTTQCEKTKSVGHLSILQRYRVD